MHADARDDFDPFIDNPAGQAGNCCYTTTIGTAPVAAKSCRAKKSARSWLACQALSAMRGFDPSGHTPLWVFR